MVSLFQVNDIIEFVTPTALILIQVKVSEVRHTHKHMLQYRFKSLSSHYHKYDRKSRAIVRLLDKRSCWEVCISEVFFSHLLELAEDAVPNVRLKIAQSLSRILQEMFHNETLSSIDEVI